MLTCFRIFLKIKAKIFKIYTKSSKKLLNNFSSSIFYEDFESELKPKIKCVKSLSFFVKLNEISIFKKS